VPSGRVKEEHAEDSRFYEKSVGRRRFPPTKKIFRSEKKGVENRCRKNLFGVQRKIYHKGRNWPSAVAKVASIVGGKTRVSVPFLRKKRGMLEREGGCALGPIEKNVVERAK